MAENDPRGATSLLTPILNPDPSLPSPPLVIEGGLSFPDVFETLPVGEEFIFVDPFTGQRETRSKEFQSLTLLDEATPEGRAIWDSLPDGAYYRTPSESIMQKPPAPGPSLFERGYERFLGMDIDPKSLGVEIPRIVSTMQGGIAGGRVGTMLPIPTTNPYGIAVKAGGTLALGGLGAAMGAIMPEQAMLYAERIGLAPEGFRDEYGYTDEELRTLFLGEGILDMAFGGTRS